MSSKAPKVKRKLFSARAVLAAPRVITMTESGIRACADRDASGGPVCDEAGASCAPLAFLSRPPPRHPRRARFSRAIGTPGTPRRSTSFAYTPAGRLTRLRRPSDLNPRLSPSAADETVALSLPCVSFHVGDDATENPGTLHVTTRRLVWFPDDDATEGGYDVPLRAVAMHAVSSDESEGFRPCIYAQIEGGAPEGSSRRFTAETARDAAAGEEEDGAAEEDETTELEETTELRLAPADPAALGALFKALCDCAALNPDPEDEMHETDDAEDDELYYDESEMATGAGAAARLDALRTLRRPARRLGGSRTARRRRSGQVRGRMRKETRRTTDVAVETWKMQSVASTHSVGGRVVVSDVSWGALKQTGNFRTRKCFASWEFVGRTILET